MAKKTDGRTRRGEVRRLAWQHAADSLESRPEWIEVESERLLDLYRETRREVLRWMRARAKGVMGPPPGGVGSAR